LDHLVLTVRDPEATVEFYSRVLGMEPITFADGRLALRFGQQKFNLHRAGAEHKPHAQNPTPGSADFCLLSDAPAAFWLSELARLQVPILAGPVPRTGAVGEMHSLYIRDPDGNLLEIASYQTLADASLDLAIVSGGQTGVDRGALEAALALNVPCGGWCPKDRMAEDGPIAARFPLKELAGGYSERTQRNVVDSDGTVIIFFSELEGGTQHTLSFCIDTPRPYCLIDACEMPQVSAARRIFEFVRAHDIKRLNVAGPRASKQPTAFDYTRRVMEILLSGSGSGSGS
jgi:catechol 2,3-dioxygenase-like lactoylglutathione lyase family enzyme